MRKIRTLIRNASAMSGKAVRKVSPEKNEPVLAASPAS